MRNTAPKGMPFGALEKPVAGLVTPLTTAVLARERRSCASDRLWVAVGDRVHDATEMRPGCVVMARSVSNSPNGVEQ